MYYVFLMMLSVILVGCCSFPSEVSFNPGSYVSSMSLKEPRTVVVKPPYPHADHFVACRASYEIEHEKIIVNNIIQSARVAAKESKKNIVLYFHGGLSDQKYMLDDLGKRLMENVFHEGGSVAKRLHPIFLNYDAGPYDRNGKLIHRDKVIDPDGILPIAYLKKYVEDIEQILSIPNAFSEKADTLQVDLSTPSIKAIYEFSGRTEVLGVVGAKEISEDDSKYFLSILEAEELPPEFERNDPQLLNRLDYMAESHREVLEKEMKNNATDSLIQLNGISLEDYKLRILRVLSRYALKNDHGLVATIQEEILDFLQKKIVKKGLGVKHWDKVKLHSKQCFSEGSNGLYLIKELLKLKDELNEDNQEFKINTLSHSAGAIPTSELIQVLGEGNLGALDQVVMVVPAISQRVFSKFVVPNTDVFESLHVYSLTEKAERNDVVANKNVYSSSLLYGVSSLAERGIAMDRMLLIEQHMKPNRKPYKFRLYQRAVCESPQKVWDYFASEDKAIFFTYPFKGEGIKANGATHENTKYPWESKVLAREYFKVLGVDEADDLQFSGPKI